MPASPFRHHRREPQSDPLAIPTGLSGVSAGAQTISADAGTATNLAVDTDSAVASNALPASQALVPGVNTIIITSPAAPTPSTTVSFTLGPTDPASTDSPAQVADASSHSSISSGAVAGVIVGAIAGVILLLLLVLYCNRRDREAQAEIARGRKLSDAANARGEAGRRRSRTLGQWDKLGDGVDEKSDHGRSPSRETVGIAAFKSAASVHSLAVSKSPSPGPEGNYFNIDPNLLADADARPPARPYVGREAAAAQRSWGDETLTVGDSLASMKSMRVSGAMSPTLAMLKTTPPVVAADGSHRWESAEVVVVDEDGNPFADASGQRASVASTVQPRSRSNSVSSSRRASQSNPFFGGGDYRQGTRARSASNPFDDHATQPLPPMPTLGHQAKDSTASVAMQSLIAALQLPTPSKDNEETASEMHSRLPSMQPSIASDYLDLSRVTSMQPSLSHSPDRVASMQPSILSNASTAVYDDVFPTFPLPPDARR